MIGWESKEDEPTLCKITAEYWQDNDCVGDQSKFQKIVLTTEDNGTGQFIRIRIPEDPDCEGCWSIDPDSTYLQEIIEDFKQRIK